MDTYIGDIIDSARGDSRNDGSTAITDDILLRYANYAQKLLQLKISKKYPRTFLTQEKLNMVASQPFYTPVGNVFLGTKVHLIRYYPSLTEDRNFYRLLPISPYQKYLSTSGAPKHYERRGGDYYLYPYPDSATGRIEFIYEYSLNKLDLRRARVNGTPSGAIIDLTHSTYGAPTTANEALFVAGQYVSLCDSYGTVLLKNGVISSYNASNDEVTLAANVSTYLETGYALSDLADAYLTVGKWTSTHSGLVNEAEPYLGEYITRRTFIRDSAEDATDVGNELSDFEKAILDAYKVPDGDAHPIPVIDTEVLIYGYGDMDL